MRPNRLPTLCVDRVFRDTAIVREDDGTPNDRNDRGVTRLFCPISESLTSPQASAKPSRGTTPTSPSPTCPSAAAPGPGYLPSSSSSRTLRIAKSRGGRDPLLYTYVPVHLIFQSACVSYVDSMSEPVRSQLLDMLSAAGNSDELEPTVDHDCIRRPLPFPLPHAQPCRYSPPPGKARLLSPRFTRAPPFAAASRSVLGRAPARYRSTATTGAQPAAGILPPRSARSAHGRARVCRGLDGGPALPREHRRL